VLAVTYCVTYGQGRARLCQRNARQLKLFLLPGYAPELNPDELVWSHMKRTGTAKRPLTSKELLQDRIEADLFKIQKSPALVRSFFKAPEVVYISDG
jgi:transposase